MTKKSLNKDKVDLGIHELRDELIKIYHDRHLPMNPYNGYYVTIPALFIVHRWSTTEIALFARMSERLVRASLYDHYKQLAQGE